LPLYIHRCSACGVKTPERIWKSYEEATSHPPACQTCHKPMELDVTVSFSFSAFRSFTTDAFGFRPGQRTIEVSDRAQLRRLLRENRMVEQGDSSSYFGSNPKSMPTWKEVCTQGKSGGDPKSAKLVHTGTVKDWEKVKNAAEQTDYGRKQSETRPDFVIGR
jgi:hypothetical protein